jgi:V-type H+-transporting ATPase subunit H
VLICHDSDIPSLASALVNHPDPYKPFLPLLCHSTNPEDAIPLLASVFLTSLVSIGLVPSSKPSKEDEEVLLGLYTYLSSLTKNAGSGLQDIGVQEFSTLLRTRRSREIFWSQRKQTVDPLVDILRGAANAKEIGSTTLTGTSSARSFEPGIGGGVGLQLLYHVLLVIWQLSFEGSLVGNDLES